MDAAVRELEEETGIVIEPAQLGAPSWRRFAAYRCRGTRRVQSEVIVTVRLAGPGPAVDGAAREPHELEDYFGFRWWPLAELLESTARFYPGPLPELLPAFLAGEQIDEPFELWS